MAQVGREEEIQEEIDPLKVLVRIAEGVEKLAADPQVELEVGPPICPHCGKMNPIVVLPMQEGDRGPMAEIIVDCTCTNCGKALFIVIESYSCHMMLATAKDEITEKKEAGFFNGGIRGV